MDFRFIDRYVTKMEVSGMFGDSTRCSYIIALLYQVSRYEVSWMSHDGLEYDPKTMYEASLGCSRLTLRSNFLQISVVMHVQKV